MILKIFHDESLYRHGNFYENRENYIKGEFIKIWEFILVIIFTIFRQKCQFSLQKSKFSFFSEFSLIMWWKMEFTKQKFMMTRDHSWSRHVTSRTAVNHKFIRGHSSMKYTKILKCTSDCLFMFTRKYLLENYQYEHFFEPTKNLDRNFWLKFRT